MRDGLSGAALPPSIPQNDLWNELGEEYGVSPALIAAFAGQESDYTPTALSGDGGHGEFQETTSPVPGVPAYPADWTDPETNARYALDNWLCGGINIVGYWRGETSGPNGEPPLPEPMMGDAFVKCVGASYNGGLSAAIANHAAGDVDLGTTNSYGARLVARYHDILGGNPE